MKPAALASAIVIAILASGCVEDTPKPITTTPPAPTWTAEEEEARTQWLSDLETALGNHIATFGGYMDSGSQSMGSADYDDAERDFGRAEAEATAGQGDVQPVTASPAPGFDTLANAVDAYFADAIKYADYTGKCAANYEHSGWTDDCDTATTYAYKVDADQDRVIRELQEAKGET